MQYLILGGLVVLLTLSILLYLLIDAKELTRLSEEKKRLVREKELLQWGTQRFRISDKVKIVGQSFYERPDCYGIITYEHYRTFDEVRMYKYGVEVRVGGKRVEMTYFSSNDLELLPEETQVNKNS
jgi:hypothetical protein